MLNPSPAPRDGFVVWHPLVHERFHERLYFFLLALKPYKEEQFRSRLRELLNEFGIPVEEGFEGFCSYEVLGEFDHLLRVWLPAQSEAKFLTRARVLLPNLKAIPQFGVLRTLLDWRFPKSPDLSTVKRLKVDVIKRSLRGGARDQVAEFVNANVACWLEAKAGSRKNGGTTAPYVNGDGIKAFIALQPPPHADDDQKQGITDELIKTLITLHRDQLIRECSLYEGTGFTWLFAKVVAKDFKELANLVASIGKFAGFGISTSTYAAIRWHAEGDSFSAASLEEGSKYPPEVSEWLPDVKIADEALIEDLARFIKRKLTPRTLSTAERRTFTEFLRAVVDDDPNAAATLLFLPNVQAEREIRDRLKILLMREFHNDLQKVAEYFKSRKLEFKTLDTIALGPVLLVARDLLVKSDPNAPIGEYGEENLNQVARLRNKLMHGVELNLKTDWEELAEQLLSLMDIREKFVSALSVSIEGKA